MQQQQNILAPYHAEELLKKYKYKEYIINICREMGKYFFYFYKILLLKLAWFLWVLFSTMDF